MMSDFLTPVHADGFTRTASERGYFVSKGDISLGLAAVGSGLVTLGLVAPFLVGITRARRSLAGCRSLRCLRHNADPFCTEK